MRVDVTRKLDVVLVPGGLARISGVVRDSRGVPIAQTRMYVYSDVGGSAEVVTEVDGSYSLVVAPGRYSLAGYRMSGEEPAEPAGFSFGTQPFDVSGDRTVDVTLLATSTLTVRVLGSDGAPVVGARVDLPSYFSDRDDWASGGVFGSYMVATGGDGAGVLAGVTDASGEVRFAVFSGSRPATAGPGSVVPPDDSGYGRQALTPPSSVDDDATVDVHLRPLAHVSGAVRDSGGAPVSGVRMYLYSDLGASSEVVTGADGSYALAAAPGRYSMAGYRTSGEGDSVPASFGFSTQPFDLDDDRVVDVGLLPVSVVTVRVLGSDGAPVVGARVDLPSYFSDRDDWASGGVLGSYMSAMTSEAGDLSGVTGEDGQVRFAVFRGSRVSGQAAGTVTPPDGSGYGQQTFTPPARIDDDATVEVQMQPLVHVSGALRDSGGAPVAGVRMYAYSAESSTPEVVTDADGSYALAVAPGRYSLAGYRITGEDSPLAPAGFSIGTQPFDVVADRTVDVTLLGTSALTVQVLGSDGAPVVGARVDLPSYFSDREDWASGGVLGSYMSANGVGGAGLLSGVTDASGEARFTVFSGSRPGTAGPASVMPPPDSGYGAQTIAPPTSIDGDTTLVVRFGSADATAPVVACDAPPSGWHADDVSVACTASDDGSGLADAADASFSLTTSVGDGDEDAGARTGTRQVCDRAGNCATAGPVGPIAVDRKPPAIAFSQQPNGANGWWDTSPGSTHATASDLTIATLDCSLDGAPQALVPTSSPGSLSLDVSAAGEGRHAVSCTATDGVGHPATGGDSVRIDLTAPNAPVLQPDRAPDFTGRGGWYRDAVTVSVAGNGDPPLADGSAGSGVDPASLPAPQTLTTSGNHGVGGSVADLAGNVSAVATAVFKLDADAPETTLDCPARAVRIGARTSARWKDRDGESGLATAGTGSISLDSSRAGTYSVQHTAIDNVGHSASSSCAYTVV
ncbi:MAG TPA: carboxypeptidase-like regulatory domain-containing protein [Conexibacter sp.]